MNNDNRAPHLRRVDNRWQLWVEGAPFLMLGGETHNSTSSDATHLRHACGRARELGCNTILAPVTWELLEAREGEWDFSLVAMLLDEARRHDLKLVPLWFGAYKNASSSYAPAWVKTDFERFPRAETAPEKRSDAVSVFCDELRNCDARAFAVLMSFFREHDREQKTVIAVQVENEVGLLGAPRDLSPLAQAAFLQAVPETLTDYLAQHRSTLHPALSNAWSGNSSGHWSEVFGAMADEAFMAWGFASFVDFVACAGRKEYSLPLLANAWLDAPGESAGQYPSGGPVARVHDIWRAVAASIEILAPDIYAPDFPRVCAEYSRGGAPLLIPEARRDGSAAACAFHAFGEHRALGFAPFGIESIGETAPHLMRCVASNPDDGLSQASTLLRQSYRLLQSLATVLFDSFPSVGIFQGESESSEREFGGYKWKITFRPRQAGRPPAGGLIFSLAPDEFLIAGFGFRADVFSLDAARPTASFLEVWEGEYSEGNWQAARRLNGDEQGITLDDEPALRRARLYCY